MDVCNNKRRIGIFSILLLMFVSMLSLVPMDALADNDETSSYSFYQKASDLSLAFDQAVTPQEAVEGSGDGSVLLISHGTTRITTGQAGALLGYSQATSDYKGVKGWLKSEVSINSATYNYDQLGVLSSKTPGGSGDSSTKATQVLISYAMFGRTLNTLGFDNTSTVGSSMGRALAGSVIFTAYLLASLAPMLFIWAVKLMKMLNPFALVGAAVAGLSDADLPPLLSGAVDYVSSLYSSMQNLSMFVLMPILLAMTLFSLLVFRKTSGSKKIIRFAIRFLFMFGGVAIIGSTYTAVLDNLDDMTEDGARYSDYVVVSSFLDFEAWAQNTRLALPSATYSLGNTFYADNETYTSGISGARRDAVLKINAMSYKDQGLMDMMNSMKATSIWDKAMTDANDQLIGNSHAGPDEGMQTSISSLLMKYMSGDMYYSGSYEGFAKADYGNIDTGLVAQMYTKLDDVLSKEGNQSGLLGSGDNEAKPFKYTIYNAGSLRRDGNYFVSADIRRNSNNVISTIGTNDASGAQTGGLTPLSMYNYLNTKFMADTMVVYSPVKSSSGYVFESHRSVNFVSGSGVYMFYTYIEVLVILLGLAALTAVYAFGLLQVSLASVSRILPGIFGSAVGSIGYITKLLISTAVLLIEIMGTILLYGITQYIAIGIMVNMDDIFSIGANNLGLGLADASRSILTSLLFVAVIWFSGKNRKVFVKAMEETVTAIINKMMGALDNNVNEGNAFGNNADAIKRGMSSGLGQDKENDGKSNAEQLDRARARVEQQDRMGQLAGDAPMSKAAKAAAVAGTMGRYQGARAKDALGNFIGIKTHALETEMAVEEMRASAREQQARTGILSDQNNENFVQDGSYGKDGQESEFKDGLSEEELFNGEDTNDEESVTPGLSKDNEDVTPLRIDDEENVAPKFDEDGNPIKPKSKQGTKNNKNKNKKDIKKVQADESQLDANGNPIKTKPNDPNSLSNELNGTKNKDGKKVQPGENPLDSNGKPIKPKSKQEAKNNKNKNKKDNDERNQTDIKKVQADEPQLDTSYNQIKTESNDPNSLLNELNGTNNTNDEQNQTNETTMRQSNNDGPVSLGVDDDRELVETRETGGSSGIRRTQTNRGLTPGVSGKKSDRSGNNASVKSDSYATNSGRDESESVTMSFDINQQTGSAMESPVQNNVSNGSNSSNVQNKQQPKRRNMMQRKLDRAVNTVSQVAGSYREGLGDGYYGERNHQLRKNERMVKDSAWGATRREGENNKKPTVAAKRLVRTMQMRSDAAEDRRDGIDPMNILSNHQHAYTGGQVQQKTMNRQNQPIQSFARGNAIRLTNQIPLSGASGVQLGQSASSDVVQSQINRLVNDSQVNSTRTYKQAIQSQRRETTDAMKLMNKAHNELNNAKKVENRNAFSANQITQLDSAHKKAKAEYEASVNKMNQLKQNSVALVHTEGMPTRATTGGQFKGDPIYVKKSLLALRDVQQQMGEAQVAVARGGRTPEITRRNQARLNALKSDQNKLLGLLQKSGFDTNQMLSAKSTDTIHDMFEHDLQSFINAEPTKPSAKK